MPCSLFSLENTVNICVLVMVIHPPPGLANNMVSISDGGSEHGVRAYGMNQVFRFVTGIWLHRKSRQIRFFSLEKDLFYFIPAQDVLSCHFI